MSDAYVECLVKAKSSVMAVFCKFLLLAIAVISFFGILIGISLAIIPCLLASVGAYFVNMYADLEYEYLYLDKELVVDKIMAKSKRKRMATYTLDRMEILAPIKSYHLDNYKNRNVKEKDYSIGQVLQPDLRYAMYYEGGEKIILSPSPEMIKIMKSAAPRKVFSD
ncbi:MAG: hypothetical protein J1E03_00890 [Acetatifactor sp.]|nr:hypothetical protein [Acetatifactor sp.]